MSDIKRICLWSGPRNISTTLMYSFAQRKDTKVFDEPLYGYYLKNTKAKEYHPAADEIISTLENDGTKVIEMMMRNHEKSVIFFKNMTHHLLDLDHSFMKDTYNIILTRDPYEMIPSFAKVIKNPTIKDIGYQDHINLLNYFKKSNIQPIVLDSKKILDNPKRVLSKVCDIIGIPFDEHMLHWDSGQRTEDGLWAKYWYTNIHKSKGFMAYKKKTEPFPDHLRPLLKSCIPYYKTLMELAID